MNNQTNNTGIWFVYDGDCPLCTHAALALRIKEAYGSLHLINAREADNNPLIEKINQAQLDLDEGMVIYDGNRFFHGKDALRFMAHYGDHRGLFNWAAKALFWSENLAKLTYPWLRGIRNYLLRRNSRPRIDNLQQQNSPIFKSIFGDAWDELPPVMQKHYANRPYTDDITLVKGTMGIACAGIIKYLSPLLWLMGGIPPITAKNVPVTVQFTSDKNTKAFHFNREFFFNNRKPYPFRSYMLQINGNEVVERMRFGLCWRLRYSWEENQVKMNHRGYALHLFGHFVPLPLTWLLGAGNAQEWAVDSDRFAMRMDITHPWWGKVYTYKGEFTVVDKP